MRLYTPFFILSSSLPAFALPSAITGLVSSLQTVTNLTTPLIDTLLHRRDDLDSTTNSSNTTNSTQANSFLWIIEDVYQGQNFFDDWTFYTGADPTHGLVTYVDQSTAQAEKLAFVDENNTVIMKGDDTNWLPLGQNRSSVRIQSNKVYTGGLFILDMNQAPWGCGVWPAFWTVGDNWPTQGEIDILEGVHNNMNNQVTWHTASGCNLTLPANFTGTPVGQTNCDALLNDNAGCGIIEWSKASYGDEFDATGGGVFAMQWDETGISVWNFYRVSVPQDIVDSLPNPANWGLPSAYLSPDGCDPFQYFYNHSIVFDLTFCGDWAGNTYDTTPGCPGTCPEHLQDPSNFVNASWSINFVKVYQKQQLQGIVTGAAPQRAMMPSAMSMTLTAALLGTVISLIL